MSSTSSCTVSLAEFVASRSDSAASSAVTAVFALTPDSSVVLVGDRAGRLSCLVVEQQSQVQVEQQQRDLFYRIAWSVDAQVGSIEGIAAATTSASATLPALVAVYGQGDAAVNVFAVCAVTRAVTLRWRCTGHLYGVTAASVVWAPGAQSALLVTCGREGFVQLFELHQRAVPPPSSSAAASAVAGCVAVASMKVVVPEDGFVPVAIAAAAAAAGSSASAPLHLCGNLIVVCRRKKDDAAEALFVEIDLLAKQRAAAAGAMSAMFGGGAFSMMQPQQQANFGAAVSSAASQLHQPNVVQRFLLSELLSKSGALGSSQSAAAAAAVTAASWDPVSRTLRLLAPNNGSSVLQFRSLPLSVSGAPSKSIHGSSSSSSSDTCGALLFSALALPGGSSILSRWEQELAVAEAVSQQRLAALNRGGGAAAKHHAQQQQQRARAEQSAAVRSALSLIGAQQALRRRARPDDDDGEASRTQAEIGKVVTIISQLTQLGAAKKGNAE